MYWSHFFSWGGQYLPFVYFSGTMQGDGPLCRLTEAVEQPTHLDEETSEMLLRMHFEWERSHRGGE